MRLLTAAAALALVMSCRPAPATLEHTRESAEAVATALMEALAAGEAGNLEQLALSEAEFRRRIWPELPASRPERNLPFSYVWGDLRQKSTQSLQQLLVKHKGHRYTLEGVRFGDTTEYPTFKVHRDSVFIVRGADEPEIRLCGSMIEADGRWKVFSFIADE
jgi:hypothetical protein